MQQKKLALTLDLESSVSGILAKDYSLFSNLDCIETLLKELESRRVPLTVFAVGEIIEDYPQVIDLFAKYNCEFHCHSYSHNPEAPDSAQEIAKSRQAFRKYFKRDPLGYRAPQGRISGPGIRSLVKEGFKFDSSVFPSYYPNPFKYLWRNRSPHWKAQGKILEIPFTSISLFRITLSISYIKLLGYKAFSALARCSKLPVTAVFGTHLHDFFLKKEQLRRLPLFWRFIYSRNRNRSSQFLFASLEYFKNSGYDFVYMSDIYRHYAEKDERKD